MLSSLWFSMTGVSTVLLEPLGAAGWNLQGPIGLPSLSSESFMLTRADGLFDAARCPDRSATSCSKSQPSLTLSVKTLTNRAAAGSSRSRSRAKTAIFAVISLLPAGFPAAAQVMILTSTIWRAIVLPFISAAASSASLLSSYSM